LGVFEQLLEIKVLGFEVGRIGIGNIAREHFQALVAQAECFFMHAECLVNKVHVLFRRIRLIQVFCCFADALGVTGGFTQQHSPDLQQITCQ